MVVSSSTSLLVVAVASVVAAFSLVVIAYAGYRVVGRMGSPLEREQLRAYHEIMSAVVSLNRSAVGLHTDDQFQLEQERYVMDNDSKLDEEITDVIEAYHRSFYLISDGVRKDVGEYVDYVTGYHPNEGIEVGKMLRLSGAVVESIRSDLGLEKAFPSTAVDEDVSPDQIPDQPDTGEETAS
jgi:hypothetical protein